jgi:prepilin-type N-terminal cleavage/methylation domain-containing protein
MMSPSPDKAMREAALTAGFTLIELSVVLIIIGFIVGGVLVAQDLIKNSATAAIRIRCSN